MKRILIICLLFFSAGVFAQMQSWNGNGLKPNAKVRTLNLFVNIIYDINPTLDPCLTDSDTNSWGKANVEGVNIAPIPTFLTDTTFMDVEHKIQPKGTMTRLYRESSFDSLRIIGDFMVINLKESRVLNNNNNVFSLDNIIRSTIDFINVQGGLQTLYGHNAINEYDYNNNGRVFYTQVFLRNTTEAYGGLKKGSGLSGSNGSKLSGYYILVNNISYPFEGRGTCQCIGGGNLAANPTGIVCHEIFHSLFGSNEFHTSGGNHRATKEQMPFLTIQGGYGLMGAANSSLVGCNGYERWRMHWKHPLAPDYITARDVTNSSYMISDISKADGNLTFYLRDFVTYGDAVRIRLPYKDSSACSNQYIWLENHQVGYNNKLDFLQHSNTASCRQQGTAGIYAYYQIGRDVLSGNKETVYFENERDNIKMIPAEGYYNYSKHELPEGEGYNLRCVNWGTHNYFQQREEANPFNGYQDQEIQFHPADNENVIGRQNEYPMWRKVIGSDSIDWLPHLGEDSDAFTTHVKIGMATNPSSCNAKVYYNYLTTTGDNDYTSNLNNPRNVRTTYLTGLSIEMVPQANHDFIVHVRWDDYDITQQANWTGRIMLKEQAHLLRGSRITLTQNLTPEQPFRDAESGQFAPTTRMLCQNGSLLTMQGNAVMELEKKSSLLLEPGCRLNLSDTASIRIGAGCRMEAAANATIRMGGQSRILVDSGGVLLLRDSVLFSDSARIVVRPGGQLVTEAAVLTSPNNRMWTGVIVEGNIDSVRMSRCQGTVILRNNTVVSHARCGILVRGGGIIRANQCRFQNNERSVVMEEYSHAQTVPSVLQRRKSYFEHCTFEVNSQALFADTGSFTHVALYGIRDAAFVACSFTDIRNNAYVRLTGTGIYAFLASVDLADGGGSQQNGTEPNLFSGLGTAISLQNSAENSSRITCCHFDNNLAGIHALCSDFLTVRDNEFSISNPVALTIGNVYGLILENSTQYRVFNNLFTGMDVSAVGVAVAHSGENDNLIKQNTFNGLCAACVADGTNGCHNSIFDMGGLEFRCNSFQDNSSDILLKTDAVVHPFQGSWNAAAGNGFASSSVNLRNDNPTSHVRYYWNQMEPSQQPSYTGLVTLYTTQQEGCSQVGYQQDGSSNDLISMTVLEQAYQEALVQYQELAAQYEAVYHNTNIPATFFQGQEAAIADLSETKGSLTRICNTALYHITADSIFDRPLYELWLGRLFEPSRNYPLLESYYRHSDSSDFTALRNSMLAQSSRSADIQRLAQLYTMRNGADSAGLGWRQWDASSRNSLSAMAAGNGYAAAVARSVRSAYYGEVYRYDSLHFLFPPLLCLSRNEAAPAEDSVPQKKGYESFFGKEKTEYSLFSIPCYYISDFDTVNGLNKYSYGSTRSYSLIATDTLFQNTRYAQKYFYSPEHVEFENGEWYFREDSLSGRLYQLHIGIDTLEYVICDLSLNIGDTFRFPDYGANEDPSLGGIWVYNGIFQLYIVDSILYVQNRKVLRLNLYQTPHSIYFIEGIGCTESTLGSFCVTDCGVMPYLSCIHKDDSLVYIGNSRYGCDFSNYSHISESATTKLLHIYPNPAQDYLQVKNEDMADGNGEIVIVNALGMVMHCGRLVEGEARISLHGWASGIYTLLYRSEKGSQQVRFVKE